MDFTKFDPLRKSFSIDGTNSAVIFTSATGCRWNLVAWSAAWTNVSNSTTFSFWEFSSVTNSVNFFTMMTSTTQGFRSAYLSDLGFQASDTVSGLKIIGGTCGGTLTGLFVGYRTGG